jgi:hypothetical protein
MTYFTLTAYQNSGVFCAVFLSFEQEPIAVGIRTLEATLQTPKCVSKASEGTRAGRAKIAQEWF